ncbi:MAG: DNA mismatch repair protein MutS, partial [Chloroflexi bacterium]|nr:DNA mismatch repair protein MutS [Chloroflexota bacterium]
TETLRGGKVEGSLLGVLDRTVTPMGRRLLRQWVNQPLLDVARINRRLDGVAFFFDDPLTRAEVREALKPLADLERLVNRVAAGSALPRDLVALRATLRRIPDVRALLPSPEHPVLGALVRQIDPVPEALDLLERAIADEPPATLQHIGVIRRGFSPELDRIYDESQHAREWIANLEAVERQRTGIKNLKVGYNKVFGYYIEVTKANAALVPKHYIRKQTLVNAERYITPEMKEYEALVLHAEERIRELEGRLFKEVVQRLAGWRNRLLGTARALAVLDVLAGLAQVAEENDYVRPQVVEEPVLAIRDGRHPVVERTLEETRFVPNDAIFEEGEIVRILTGPNMSGKSTFLRQVALIVLMAQMGSFVPAREATIGVVDRIFTRIGAQDEIHAGQSTFMVEMVETAHILHHATPRSLVILDEIGRGTSTYDGLAIAWAIVEYIHNHPKLRSKTLFATHYHELTQLADLLPGVRNYHVAVSEEGDRVVFLHRILPGRADRSYGIHVAQLAGLPRAVIQRAQEILQRLEAAGNEAAAAVTTGRGPSTGRRHQAVQLSLFPETNPLLDELRQLDINNLTPIEALNLLYKWKQQWAKA